jgi:hypothetical protein
VSLRDLYEQYHEQVQFLTIYIREAHPKDGWWFGGGVMGRIMKKGIPKVATEIFRKRSKNAVLSPVSAKKACRMAYAPM